MQRLVGQAGRFCAVVGCAVLLMSGAGCFVPETIRPEQLDRGYILLLPGVESAGWSVAGIVRGLREAGVDQAIEVDEWGDRPFGTFHNLPAVTRNRQRAAERAAKLARYRKTHPDQPITIIGYSGGGGMALFIAEALPENMVVDRIILLGAAVSPKHELGPILARCRRGIVNFYSQQDWFISGLGTEVFGTMDRDKTSSAGRVGFRDGAGKLRAQVGLTQFAWTGAWRRLGHDGGHLGWRAQPWAREILAPQIASGVRSELSPNQQHKC